MTDATFLAEQLTQARAECQRCAGRANGDCGGSDCRYFALTATAAEREQDLVERATAWRGNVRRAVRSWSGATRRERAG